MQFTMDPFQMLASQQKVYVKEKIKILEFIGIDQANKYAVKDVNGNEMFIAKETTGFCARCCLPTTCRPFNLEMFIKVPGQSPQPFIKADKECQMTCCCLNRPKMQVMNNHTGQQIGILKDDFDCCNHIFSINDNQENPTLRIKGNCMQCGICCKCPCGPCKYVKFDITDMKSQQAVGQIVKENTCLGTIADDMNDKYWVDFGAVSEPQWKAMLVTAAIFIDFRMFQGGKKDENSTG
uniref:Phospholipid scramblase n=1 Tax=Chromera velia CCMP2878 TaxID=1169474 RepID=A0A0G4IB44_9ALVE|eukprot:Cvel_12647.t1-p1 / transcript=Cvel_12647.t1 / gene=Cvel_12647 / organism=Chromera_velia_CCMP2878 / gene_product=Phospholipid scramblase 1, putative / transcript_product=Phospholipid scramblase 1, putative / location=Cvel_scaffold835:37808-42058(-) / protein_length=236 / sequence_SO=supercontig / SO=protein_coding / is_pseudo=false